MQARGLHHRVVIWLGFHGRLFPRQAAADPYLPDGARARLAAGARKPLAGKLESGDEERLLLALTLASARERLVLSFQRSDDRSGRLARSSALREVARAFTGKPDPEAILGAGFPDHVPAHPGQRALHLASSPRLGLLPPGEAVAGAAVAARQGTAAARALLAALDCRDGHLDATLSAVEAIESFAPGRGLFDGRTDRGLEASRRLSPSAVERLARCPLSFFLRYELRLKELEEEAEPHRVEKWLLGKAAHAALAATYARLDREGWFQGTRPARARARELLEAAWRERLEEAAGPSYERLRGFFDLLGTRWLEALRAFVDQDVEAIQARGPSRLEVEVAAEGRVAVPDGDLALAGWIDRLIASPDGFSIDDFKTSRKVADKVDAKSLLTGNHLQLFLYREALAGARGLDPAAVRARLLAIGPHAPAGEEESVLEAGAALRQGTLETIGVVLGLAREGWFPLLKSEDANPYCNYCGYRRTCRKDHEPTRQRLEATERLRDFFRAKHKNRKRPLLAQFPAGEDDEAEDGGEAT
jgi:RecB family exonuclease